MEKTIEIPEGYEARIEGNKVILELKESEDEKIRIELIFFLNREIPQCSIQEHANKLKEFVAWVEKQKEKPKTTDSIPADCESSAKCENEHNKPGDFVFELRQIISRHRYADMYGECVDDEEGMAREIMALCEQEKEQKPVQDREEREYVRTLKSLIADFLRDKDEVDREYYQKIYDWLDGRHIEQKLSTAEDIAAAYQMGLAEGRKEQKPKPVFKVGDKIKLKSEPKYPYREIVDIRNGSYYFDEAVHLPFDNQDNWEKEQKPAEWSEEDEKNLKLAYDLLVNGVEADRRYPKLISWLKSLRPSWKPSEEQMDALKKGIEYLAEYGTSDDDLILNTLYADLEKL